MGSQNPSPKLSGSGQEEPAPLFSGAKVGRLRRAVPNHSPSPLEEEEPALAAYAPCKAGVVEPSIIAKVLESEKQRNTLQKVISLIRREHDLKVPESEASSILTVYGVEDLWAGSSSPTLASQLPVP